MHQAHGWNDQHLAPLNPKECPVVRHARVGMQNRTLGPYLADINRIPIARTSPGLACRIGPWVPIWQPLIGSP
jgi:hypothetical protein